MEKKHLPMYGIGPIYVCIILFITALGIILTNMNVIPNLNNEILKNFFIIVGILLIIFGLYVWVRAVIIEKIDESIKDNKLRTTDIYMV